MEKAKRILFAGAQIISVVGAVGWLIAAIISYSFSVDPINIDSKSVLAGLSLMYLIFSIIFMVNAILSYLGKNRYSKKIMVLNLVFGLLSAQLNAIGAIFGLLIKYKNIPTSYSPNKKMSKETIVMIVMLITLALVLLIFCIVNRTDLTTRFNNSFSKGNLNSIKNGLMLTAIISVFGFIIGLFLGLVTCLIEGLRSQNSFVLGIKQVFKAYVSVCRGTPTVVQLLIIYFIVFATYRGPEIIIAILAFGLNSGAYIAEILRGGINSVPVGQMEAGRSLGLPYSRVMIKVVFPQAIKNCLPSLGNEFITLIKETSVASFIAIIDLTNAMKHIADASYDYALVYLVMGVIYFTIVLGISYLLKLLERSLNKNAR